MDRSKLPSLTGLRFVAAVSVVLAHSLLLVVFKETREFPRFGVGLAYFGMSLFFVLSGFVIYFNYAPLFHRLPAREAVLRFAVARFARLYPLYAFFMLVSLATIPWSRVPAMLPDLYWFIPMVQSWFLGDRQLPLMFTFDEAALTWSISTELFFYILFPLLLMVRLPRIHRFLELPLLLGAALVVLLVLYFAIPPMSTPYAQQWLIYYSPYCRLFEFISGMLTARLFLSLRGTPAGARETKIASFVAIGCGYFIAASVTSASDYRTLETVSFYDFIRPNLWNAPATIFLVFYVTRYESALRRLLSSRLVIAGGEASYSIYLMHLFVLSHFYQAPRELSVSSALEVMARISIYLLLTVAVAYGTYRVIEMPARLWIRAMFDRRQKTAILNARYASK
jgi:peptidoglycan/LPS O-acetylase OafA/YrhL